MTRLCRQPRLRLLSSRAIVLAMLVAAAGAWPGPLSPAAAAGEGEVRFSQSSFQAMEGERALRVTVERIDLPVSRVTVTYRTEAVSAVAGSDFRHAFGTLVFDVGTTSQGFTVLVVDDDKVEDTEEFLLHLDSSSGRSARSPVILLDDDDDLAGEATATADERTVTSGAGGRTPQPPSASSTRPAGAPATAAIATSPAAPRAASAARRRTVPAPHRRVLLEQKHVTPFELRPSQPLGSDLPTRVDPLLALVAGLLLARVAAEVWFRTRVLSR